MGGRGIGGRPAFIDATEYTLPRRLPAILTRAAKSLNGPERERVLAIPASIPEIVDELETVIDEIVGLRARIES